MLITSRTNSNVKQIRRLHNRRERERTGLFLVEGLQLLGEAAEMEADVVRLVLAPELLSEESARSIGAIEERAELPSLEVTPEVLDTILPQHGHQGIAAVVRQRWEQMEDVRLSSETCWVAINQIEHPGSLGTIIRVCDAVGGGGVILIGDSTDPYDPTAVRASLGAVFSQRLVKTEFAEFAGWKRRQGAFVVGTSPAGPTDYQAVSYQPPMVLFMGNERTGLSDEQQAICDVMVRIPMAGRCESHHVAVATGIVLYEILNQQRAVQGTGLGE